MNEKQPHIEIKGGKVGKRDAEKIIQKETIIGVVAGDKISPKARKLLDDAGIPYAQVQESEFMESEAQEEE